MTEEQRAERVASALAGVFYVGQPVCSKRYGVCRTGTVLSVLGDDPRTQSVEVYWIGSGYASICNADVLEAAT